MFQLPQFPGAEYIRGTSLTVLIAFVCGCGFLLFGYDQGVMSALIEEPMMAGTMPQIAKYEQVDQKQWYADGRIYLDSDQFDSNVQGAIVSCYELGALIGSIIVLWKGDQLGRRSSVAIGSTIMIIGTIIMVAHDRLPAFTVGRVIAGIGNGLDTATIPMLQSELSKAKNRGFLVFIEGALLAGGVMISYWIDFGFYFFRWNSVQWRFPIAFQAAFALVLLLGIFFIPESPRWLMKKGKYQQAMQSFLRLRNTPLLAARDLYFAHCMLQEEEKIRRSKGPFPFLELFTVPRNLRATIGATIVMFGQQFCGVNVIAYYSSSIIKNVANASDINAWRLRP